MVKVYANLIHLGFKTFEVVPETLHAQIWAELIRTKRRKIADVPEGLRPEVEGLLSDSI